MSNRYPYSIGLAALLLVAGTAAADVAPPPGTKLQPWQIGCRRTVPVQSVEALHLVQHGAETVLTADGTSMADFPDGYRLAPSDDAPTKASGAIFRLYGCFAGRPPNPSAAVPAHAEATLTADQLASGSITVEAASNQQKIDVGAPAKAP